MPHFSPRGPKSNEPYNAVKQLCRTACDCVRDRVRRMFLRADLQRPLETEVLPRFFSARRFASPSAAARRAATCAHMNITNYMTITCELKSQALRISPHRRHLRHALAESPHLSPPDTLQSLVAAATPTTAPLTNAPGGVDRPTATLLGRVPHCGCVRLASAPRALLEREQLGPHCGCVRAANAYRSHAAALPGNAVRSSRRHAPRAIHPSRRAARQPYTRGAWRHARCGDSGEDGKHALALLGRLAVARGAIRHVAVKRAHSA